MIEAVLVFGVIVFAGVAFLLAKVPPKLRAWLLGHHVALDITVSAVVLWIHWGTMTGLMAAAVAGFICSAYTSMLRGLLGFTYRGRFTPGLMRKSAP